MTSFCGQCGAQLRLADRYCPRCGAPVVQASSPPITPPPPSTPLRKQGISTGAWIVLWICFFPFLGTYYALKWAWPRRQQWSGKTVGGVVLAFWLIGIASASLGNNGSHTSTSASSIVEQGTSQPTSSVSAQPTDTPEPTDTPAPTDTPQPTAIPKRAAISVSGRGPVIQQVGVPAVIHVNVRSTGNAIIKHLILDMTGCTDHWVLDNIGGTVTAPEKSPVDNYYDIGPLWPKGKFYLTITVVPKDSGNHDCNIAFFNGWDNMGFPRGEPLDSIGNSVAINP